MSNFAPDYAFANVLSIDKRLFRGKELIIFDVDNTLFYPESTKIRPEILFWFKNVNKKYQCVCLSNSYTIQQRKDAISSILGCEIFMSDYRKPSKKLFRQIVRKYHVDPEKVLVIGDMRLTDVLFGNRNNATTILVKPMSTKELFSIRVARTFEGLLFGRKK